MLECDFRNFGHRFDDGCEFVPDDKLDIVSDTDFVQPAAAGEMICSRALLGTPIKKTVIERWEVGPEGHNLDIDELTIVMLITHREAVARNVTDCRLVIEWNFAQDDGYADFDPLIEVLHCDKPGTSFDLEL